MFQVFDADRIARLPGLGLLALPPPALAQHFFGLAGMGFTASAVGYLVWSAVPPLALALVARAVKPLRGIAAGLAFGWAGLLLHAALVRSLYLPLLPLWMVPLWLLLGSFIAWWAGRAVVVPERLR